MIQIASEGLNTSYTNLQNEFVDAKHVDSNARYEMGTFLFIETGHTLFNSEVVPFTAHNIRFSATAPPRVFFIPCNSHHSLEPTPHFCWSKVKHTIETRIFFAIGIDTLRLDGNPTC